MWGEDEDEGGTPLMAAWWDEEHLEGGGECKGSP